MIFGIAADVGRFVGLEDDLAGRLAVAPFLMLLTAQALAAAHGSLPWATAAAIAVLTLEVAVLTAQAIHWYRWVGEMAPSVVARGLYVAAALLLPLAVAWWCRRSAARVPRTRDSTDQELEKTAGPPS